MSENKKMRFFCYECCNVYENIDDVIPLGETIVDPDDGEVFHVCFCKYCNYNFINAPPGTW